MFSKAFLSREVKSWNYVVKTKAIFQLYHGDNQVNYGFPNYRGSGYHLVEVFRKPMLSNKKDISLLYPDKAFKGTRPELYSVLSKLSSKKDITLLYPDKASKGPGRNCTVSCPNLAIRKTLLCYTLTRLPRIQAGAVQCLVQT